jgi:hypothetical protein
MPFLTRLRALRITAVGVSLFLTAGALTCHQPTAVTGDEISLALPGGFVFPLSSAADGTLFTWGSSGLIRSRIGEPRRWDIIATPQAYLTQLFAVSDDEVYALTRQCGAIYRWRGSDGWSQVTQITKSPVQAVDCPQLNAVWGRDSADIYVVGAHGTLVHYDGHTWTQEVTPIDASVDTPEFPEASDIWGVAGNSSTVYAGGALLIRKQGDGVWERIPFRSDNVARCGYTAVAAGPSQGLFAFGPCISTLADAELRIVQPNAGRSVDFQGGTAAPEGEALLWSYDGFVAIMSDGRLQQMHFEHVGRVGAVAISGDWLYLAGTSKGTGTESGVVMRRRWR